MLYATPYELFQIIAKGDRVLGIDPGKKQIGLALSDVSLMLASPYETVKRGKLNSFVSYLREIALKEQIGGIVCGLPLSLDGQFGPAAQAAKDWVTAVSNESLIPACLWDERLSSSAINRFLIKEADLSRKKRNIVVDKLAASYMLQTALDVARNQ